jgi:hypothetical protein
MRTFYVSLVAVSALVIALPSLAAEKPRTAQTSPSTQSKKVWTNEDMDELRVRGLITTFNPAPEMIAQVSTVAPEPARFGPRTADPAWYANEASILQAELDRREAALREAQANLVLAQERITQPGIAMDQGNVGITPAAGIAILEAQVREVQNQLDELSDLARRSNIPPGDLRG